MSDMEDKFPFVDLANAEHRRVRTIIRAIEGALRFGRQDQAEEVSQLLASLNDEIRRHYIKESEGGLLEEAACRIPNLATRVEPLMAAWPSMAARIDALQSMLRGRPKDQLIPRPLSDMIHRALLDVVSLEVSEEEILCSAFGMNFESSKEVDDA